MTPYYDDGTCVIYHGDAMETLESLPPKSAGMVCTDPPYFRVVDEEWDNRWGADVGAFLTFIGDVVNQTDRLIIDRGTAAMFCSPDMACAVELEMRKRMTVINHIVWKKPPGRLGRMDKASMRRFFPTSERIILAEKARNPDGDLFRFIDHVNHAVAREVYADIREALVELRDRAGLTNKQIDSALGKNGMAGHYFGASQWSLPTEDAWETIKTLLRNGGVYDYPTWTELRQEFDARRREFDARRQEFDARRREFDARRREFDARRREFDARRRDIELMSDVWTFDPPAGSERFAHPTQKPIGLMRHLASTMTRTDDLIIDPFMGTGTTLRAAKDLGRRAIGIELEERYCEIAAKRLAQEVLPL